MGLYSVSEPPLSKPLHSIGGSVMVLISLTKALSPYQGLPLDRRAELATRFYRWLQPGGIAFVEMLNIRERERKLFEDPFRAVGFRVVDKKHQTQ